MPPFSGTQKDKALDALVHAISEKTEIRYRRLDLSQAPIESTRCGQHAVVAFPLWLGTMRALVKTFLEHLPHVDLDQRALE
jgi:hypothetical protein